MSKSIIKVNGLGKRYRIGAKREAYGNFREAILNAVKAPLRNFRRLKKLTNFKGGAMDSTNDIIWALKDVSFEVNEGEVVGIIGRNGSGKSTLLKILSRITEPTEGCAEIGGRVSSLLEVGTGFHKELTGRDNIYLNGAILGMRKREIDRKFDEIVAFSEIERFLDTPVKHYSSGMYVRLAFAVAAHLEPEILLVDEVLAVGDIAFQKKCMGKMDAVAREGRTVLFVSHQMASVEKICPKCILLNNGQLSSMGKSESIISQYLSQNSINLVELEVSANRRPGNGALRVKRVKYDFDNGKACSNLRCGKLWKVQIYYKLNRPIKYPRFKISIYNERKVAIASLDSQAEGMEVERLNADGVVTCTISSLNLIPGNYHLNIGVMESSSIVDHVEGIAPFAIEESNYLGTGKLPDRQVGFIIFPANWTIKDADILIKT